MCVEAAVKSMSNVSLGLAMHALLAHFFDVYPPSFLLRIFLLDTKQIHSSFLEPVRMGEITLDRSESGRLKKTRKLRRNAVRFPASTFSGKPVRVKADPIHLTHGPR